MQPGLAEESQSAVVAHSCCAGLGVLCAAIASSPLTLGAAGVPLPLRVAAGVLATLLGIAVVFAMRRGLPAGIVATSAFITGLLGATALASVARLEPHGGLVLLGGFLAVCGLAGWRPLALGCLGAALGAALRLAVLPGVPVVTKLALSIEASYGGEPVEPMWLSVQRATAIALLTILITALSLTISGRRRRWGDVMRRYDALGRIVYGRVPLNAEQAATVVGTLGDPRWTFVGIAVVRWSTIQIIAVRTSGESEWRHLGQSLRDAAVALSHPANPLARAARGGQPARVASCADLLPGMWRGFDAQDRQTAQSVRAPGRLVPFGSPEQRGVVFALASDPRADFAWLDDLAGALTLVVGTDTCEANRAPAVAAA